MINKAYKFREKILLLYVVLMKLSLIVSSVISRHRGAF